MTLGVQPQMFDRRIPWEESVEYLGCLRTKAEDVWPEIEIGYRHAEHPPTHPLKHARGAVLTATLETELDTCRHLPSLWHTSWMSFLSE